MLVYLITVISSAPSRLEWTQAYGLEQRPVDTAIPESAALNVLEYRGQLRRSLLERKRVVAVIVADRLDLVIEMTEHEALVLLGVFGDFDIRTIDSAEQESAVNRKLHITRTRGFGPRSTDLYTDIRRRDQDFSNGNAVIGNEGDPEQVSHVWVVIGDFADVDD